MITSSSLTTEQLTEFISATRIRLRQSSPFFAALALYAKIQYREDIQIAATDGDKIFFNPKTYFELSYLERDAVFLHELLHTALLHPLRRGSRDHFLFNIAADIVVNGMVAAEKDVQLPKTAIRDEEIEHHSVEEIYEIISKKSKYKNLQKKLVFADILDPSNGGSTGHYQQKDLDEMKSQYKIKGYWKQAINDSIAISKGSGNSIPEKFKRTFEEITQPEVNWKSVLWRYLVRTPNNFDGYDRRFIYSGLYLDELQGESVEVFCCIDTSASITQDELNTFIGELSGILKSYPNISCKLWYADDDCYGPYTIESIKSIPSPEGGGATDFRPFFKKIKSLRTIEKESVCVYLTDGYGYMPEKAPELPVLWVITPGGADNDYFEFGEVTRLTDKETK